MNLTNDEKEIITNWLNDTLLHLSQKSVNMVLSSKLLYDMKKDGNSAPCYHEKCDNISNAFAIIKTKHDHIIGCFISVSFIHLYNDRVEDDKVFICVIRSYFEGQGPEIFKISAEYKNCIEFGGAKFH